MFKDDQSRIMFKNESMAGSLADRCEVGGGSDGAMVLCKLSVRRRPSNFENSRPLPTALTTLVYHSFLSSLFLSGRQPIID